MYLRIKDRAYELTQAKIPRHSQISLVPLPRAGPSLCLSPSRSLRGTKLGQTSSAFDARKSLAILVPDPLG